MNNWLTDKELMLLREQEQDVLDQRETGKRADAARTVLALTDEVLFHRNGASDNETVTVWRRMAAYCDRKRGAWCGNCKYRGISDCVKQQGCHTCTYADESIRRAQHLCTFGNCPIAHRRDKYGNNDPL